MKYQQSPFTHLNERHKSYVAQLLLPTNAEPSQLYANPEDFVPILRTDPNSKLIVQLLPSDALAMIPVVQDFEEFEGLDNSSARQVGTFCVECMC